MFKIARIATKIFNAARNVSETSLASINSMFKYSTQSKGYTEDVTDEFYFESFKEILPKQSVTKDQFKAAAPILQGTNKLCSIGSYKILDSAETRKLIYARFADEIVAKSKNAEGSKNLETQSHDTKEHTATFTTYDIANEFNDLRTQGYDFAGTRKAIENQNVRSIAERMKELVLSGHISSYSGETGFKEEVEKVMHKKALVIKEFMERVNGRVEFISVDNESFTDVTMTDLLGEY